MQTNHELGFRPSALPALEQCAHYTPDERTSPEANEGTDTHKRIATMIGFDLHPPPVLEKAMGTDLQWVKDYITGYLDNGWSVYAVEYPVELYDETGDLITTGTVDLVLRKELEDGDHYIVTDWKTGQQRDYSAQIDGYLMAIRDLSLPNVAMITAHVAYVNSGEVDVINHGYSETCNRVLTIYQNWKNKDEQPETINPYCSWCKLRPNCSAWTTSAALAIHEAEALEDDPLSEAAITELKNDPVRLEKFMRRYEHLKKLVEEDWNLKDALKMHLETGYNAKHFSLVKRNPKEEVIKTVDPEQYLIHVSKLAGAMRAAQAITVDVDKAVEMWREFSSEVFPVEINQTVKEKPGYSYVRSKSS